MKLKRIFSTLLAATFIFTIAIGTNSVYADTAQSTPTLDLSVTPNNDKNYNDLKWDISGMSQSYFYRLYSKKSGETEFQSIPCKGTEKDVVKVLNIYPNVGNNLKSWMEDPNAEDAGGYGRNIIKVDAHSIDEFNANPENYLQKDSNGNWNYDVVYLGAWDSNYGQDLSLKAEETVEEFIKSGRGYLTGHDTLCYSNIDKLSNYLNIIPNVSGITYYGSTSAKINRKGLLTDYPWKIGDVGTNLTIPLSHTTAQYSLGDIWIKYNGNTLSSDSEINTYNGKACTNNFYLTTWNNTGMIQTGHSNGQATPAEQKILANTLFYLAQVTDNTSWEDHKGQDVDAPTKPVITSVTNDIGKNQVSINYNPSTDNGSTYDYYAEATNKFDGSKITSDTKTSTITTGLAGYSVVVDENPNTDPGSIPTTTSTSYVIDGAHKKDFYVHIAAIDKAGNESEVTHQKINAVTGITLDKTTDKIYTGDTDTIKATVTPDDAVNKEVTWSTSDSSIATVDQTGKVTAVKAGTATITAATANGTSATCVVTVKDLTTITLNKTTDTLEAGTTDVLTAAVTPEEIASQGVTWSTSDKTIATVDASGNVIVLGVGTANITATTADGKTASCTVTVTPEINRDKAVLYVTMINGQTKMYNMTMEDVNKFISWYRLKSTGVGALDYAINVPSISSSIVKTDYIAFDKISSFEVHDYTKSSTKSKYLTKIALNKATDKLKAGETDVLAATVTPDEVSNKGVTWSTSDKTIADVDASGKITALKDGTAVITATTDDGKTAACTVTVTQAANHDDAELSITMTNGQTKIYVVTMDDVNDFIAWRNLRAAGVGEPFYKFDLTQCSAPRIVKTDYVTFDEIASFDAEDESN